MIKTLLKQAYFSLRGNFNYFGARVFFPSGSHIVSRAIREGVFERDLVRLLTHFVKPGSCFFDVGANLGLMSLPILRDVSESKVIAFEPSPSALPFLQRTHEASPYKNRWVIIPKAIAAETGSADFFTAGLANSAFDGLQNTGRAGNRQCTKVPVTTLDVEWENQQSPKVSVIKIDVEGGELNVLLGAQKCIAACKPLIFLEWNFRNLSAHNCSPDSLLTWAENNGYQLCQLPHCDRTTSSSQLEMQMFAGEEFVLLPVTK